MNITRSKTKLLSSFFPISLFLLIFLTFNNPKKPSHQTPHLHINKHIKIAHSTCQGSLYPKLCVSTLAGIPILAAKSLPELISATLNTTAAKVQFTSSNCSGIRNKLKNLDRIENIALNDCIELLDETSDELKTALSDLEPRKYVSKRFHDLQTLLSAAITNQYTCLDGFSHSKGKVKRVIERNLYDISRRVSNSLFLLKKIRGVNDSEFGDVLGGFGSMRNGFPAWLSPDDRELLVAPANGSKFDLIVAKDGSGNFTSIGQAVAAAPNSSITRFVIYVKAGAYIENVDVSKKKTKLMLIGDGMQKTVVKSNRSVVGGWTTFRSATFAVVGNGFIAKGITFENSAGPSMHQAVALRSGSDLSAFFQCSFVGYQDTLYVHSLRQFYRECDIYGTVDFIFGNAAAVFQNCNLYARKPNSNQKNIFTAQGREDPNQNTGISILNCKVTASADLIPLKSSFKTYLGRPWKEYSRTVYLESFIDDLVEPAGWLEWKGDFGLRSLYYGEYMNRGPGSNTTSRVKWPGYRVINSSAEASQFTVGQFLQGSEWLNSTGIPFFLGLS